MSNQRLMKAKEKAGDGYAKTNAIGGGSSASSAMRGAASAADTRAGLLVAARPVGAGRLGVGVDWSFTARASLGVLAGRGDQRANGGALAPPVLKIDHAFRGHHGEIEEHAQSHAGRREIGGARRAGGAHGLVRDCRRATRAASVRARRSGTSRAAGRARIQRSTSDSSQRSNFGPNARGCGNSPRETHSRTVVLDTPSSSATSPTVSALSTAHPVTRRAKTARLGQ